MGVPSIENFGRLHAPDERDGRFPMRAALTVQPPWESLPRWRYWGTGVTLNQGNYPHCVGYAWKGWLMASPVRSRLLSPPSGPEIYRQAQRRDEWPGEDYDGTSVRGGAKALEAEIDRYVWATDVDTVVRFLLDPAGGPIVAGLSWKGGMMDTDARGFVHASGYDVGGHAVLLIGVNRDKGLVRGFNSWGLDWGRVGRFSLSFDDLAKLLADDGEACAAIQRRGSG